MLNTKGACWFCVCTYWRCHWPHWQSVNHGSHLSFSKEVTYYGVCGGERLCNTAKELNHDSRWPARTGHFATWLTQWSKGFPEKLTGPQIVNRFPAFYVTCRFITAFITARHLPLSWARSIQSMPPTRFSKVHFNIILPCTPGSSKWCPSFWYLHQNPLCTSPRPHACYMHCQT